MVYIDDFDAPFGKMKMCHMIADSTDELYAMVDAIGVQRKWIQSSGTPREHFDICLSKKKAAIAAGAIEIGMRELAAMTANRPSPPKSITMSDTIILTIYSPMERAEIREEIPYATFWRSTTRAYLVLGVEFFNTPEPMVVCKEWLNKEEPIHKFKLSDWRTGVETKALVPFTPELPKIDTPDDKHD